MKDQIERRLMELRQEHEAGERMLADLEGRRQELGQAMLRIGGAMQVLDELLHAIAAEQPKEVADEEVPLARRAVAG